jgi:hypothetical protein
VGVSGHAAMLAERKIVRRTNTGIARGRRPATIQCGPMGLTIAIDAVGRLLFSDTCATLGARDKRSLHLTYLAQPSR